jgi:hypothetical protein
MLAWCFCVFACAAIWVVIGELVFSCDVLRRFVDGGRQVLGFGGSFGTNLLWFVLCSSRVTRIFNAHAFQ